MKENDKDNIYWKLLVDNLTEHLSEEQEAEFRQLMENDPVKKRIYDAINQSYIMSENYSDDDDIEQQILRATYNKIFNEEEKRKSKNHFWLNGLKIVASILVIVSVGVISFFVGSNTSVLQNEEWIEFYCQNGGYTKLYLSDSSQVYVNAGSIIRYPAKFTENRRVVEIDGEAFFNVVKDEKRPFFVKSNLFEAKVLGTSFNTKAYSDDSLAFVTLNTGCIEVTLTDNNDKCILNPDEQVTISANTRILEKQVVDTDYYTAWKEGHLSFYKMSFKDICKILERKYGINIIIKNEVLGQNIYSGRFINNEGLFQVLDIIKQNKDFKYRPEKDNVIVIY